MILSRLARSAAVALAVTTVAAFGTLATPDVARADSPTRSKQIGGCDADTSIYRLQENPRIVRAIAGISCPPGRTLHVDSAAFAVMLAGKEQVVTSENTTDIVVDNINSYGAGINADTMGSRLCFTSKFLIRWTGPNDERYTSWLQTPCLT